MTAVRLAPRRRVRTVPPSSDRAPSELGAPARTRREGASLRGRVAALLAALGLLLVAVTERSETTDAAWSDPETAGATLTAGTLGPVRPNACDVPIDGRTFTPLWLPPAAPSVAPSGYRYRVVWQSLAGDQEVVGWTDVPATTTQFSYTVPASLLRLGTYRFEVVSIAGSWESSIRTGTALAVNLLGLPIVQTCSWS